MMLFWSIESPPYRRSATETVTPSVTSSAAISMRLRGDVYLTAFSNRFVSTRWIMGIMEGGLVRVPTEGTPQGGPLSPFLANGVLDEWEGAGVARLPVWALGG
jgi:hypothetical protein